MKSSLSFPQKTTANGAPESVPLLDLRRQYDGLRAEVLAAITRVCDSQSFILGPEVEALEGEIAALTGAACAVGCASGTEALWLALVAAGVKPGDSVITTAFSFIASASAIVRAGATPVFVDVDPGTLNLDATLVLSQLQDRRARERQAAASLLQHIERVPRRCFAFGMEMSRQRRGWLGVRGGLIENNTTDDGESGSDGRDGLDELSSR